MTVLQGAQMLALRTELDYQVPDAAEGAEAGEWQRPLVIAGASETACQQCSTARGNLTALVQQARQAGAARQSSSDEKMAQLPHQGW